MDHHRTSVIAVALVLATALGAAAQDDSSVWLRVAQQHTGGSSVRAAVGARGAVLALSSGIRVEVPPRRTATTLRISRASAEAVPCRLPRFAQIGDTIRLDGRLGRGEPATVRIPSSREFRSRAGHRLVMVAHLHDGGDAQASVGADRTVTVGANETLTVGSAQSGSSPGGGGANEIRMGDASGSQESRWSGRYYLAPARHIYSSSGGSARAELVATLDATGRFDALHFGWLPTRREAR